MSAPNDGDPTPLAWPAILDSTPVVSATGEELGIVVEVLGSESQDIFHGLVIASSELRHDVFLPADAVTEITDRKIVVDTAPDSVRGLPAYVPEDSFHLGFAGFLRHRLRWVEEGRERP